MSEKLAIGWGEYKTKKDVWEGPYYRGNLRYQIPEEPTWGDIALEVVTATEGGTYDAVNMYDRMIYSIGLIQWGAAGIFNAENLLGEVKERTLTLDPAFSSTLGALGDAMELVGVTFEQRPRPRGQGLEWRFRYQNGEWVDTVEEQRRMFIGTSTGLKGSWDPVSKHLALTWAERTAQMWRNEAARNVQREYTVRRIRNFATEDAFDYLWGAKKGDEPEDTADDHKNWVGMTRAAFLSFAANLPSVAAKHLEYHRRDCRYPKWSPLWCFHLLRELTYGPQIAIYPKRYKDIRPVLEGRFGVDLPDLPEDLLAFSTRATSGAQGKVLDFTVPKQLQQALLLLEYDLGPAGADGVIGPKTFAAIRAFQRDYMKGRVDGIVGPKTSAALTEAIAAKWRTTEGADGDLRHRDR